MDFYRGCVCAILLGFIAVVALLFASVLGLVGLLIPPVAIGFCYLVIDTVIVELLCWDRDRNSRP